MRAFAGFVTAIRAIPVTSSRFLLSRLEWIAQNRDRSIYMAESREFISGVIEGFYGEPWKQTERGQLFEWMAAWGLNTYLYAPKDDLKHRARWREVYTSGEATALAELIGRSQARGLRFVYALGPGLDIGYSSSADLERLRERFGQLLDLGCESFALLFDDIPDRMSAEDSSQWKSFAAAQCQVANTLFQGLRKQAPRGRFFFCPTPYCGRMAQRGLGGADYLQTVGAELTQDVEVFWTGTEIISATISVEHVREVSGLLRRPLVVWDNLHANDYDGRRIYTGPYSGRPPEIREHVRGILSNPNNEFPLNYVPLRTLARFVNSEGHHWNPREEFRRAVEEWLPSFATVQGQEDFGNVLLFADCHYLPHEEGPEARSFEALARSAIGGERTEEFLERSRRLREFCGRLAQLNDRPLFYALSRRAWDLREELDLLEKYVNHVRTRSDPSETFASDFHLPGTYRGGIVARLQGLLAFRDDGTLRPTSPL